MHDRNGARLTPRERIASAQRSSGRARAALVLGCAWFTFAAACGKDEAPARNTNAAPAGASAVPPLPTNVCDDERVGYLLVPGPRTEAFLRDTSDPIPGLVAQLAYGQVDPLTYSIQQIGEIGDAAVPELSRFIDAAMRNPEGSPHLQNAFGAVSLMKTPAAHALLARGLEHPQEAVRLAALRGLARHPDPADFERLASLISLTTPEFKPVLAEALLASDPVRGEAQLLDWFAAREHSPTWPTTVRLVAASTRPQTLARIPDLVPLATSQDALYLKAALARAGDAAALADLRKTLRGENPTARGVTLQALERAGLVDELVVTAQSDPDAGLRAQALAAIAGAPPAPSNESAQARTGALRRALSDGEPAVRQVALEALLARGDAEAQEQALELLKGERPAVEAAVRVLGEPWKKDAQLARRGLDILLGLRRGEVLPLRVEPRVLDRALAVVPLREAAEHLYARAIEAGDVGLDGKPIAGETDSARGARIAGISRHQWYTQQVGNTGEVGAEVLREHWKTEPDALRRLDLVAGAIYAQDDPARDFLIAALEDPRTTPCEALYIGERLARLGPVTRVAPILKRYVLGVDDRRARPALNSLLWRWFAPQP